MGWHTRLLPFLEQEALWRATLTAYQQAASPFVNPPHSGLATVVPVFGCPEDDRLDAPQITNRGWVVALTSYIGVVGTDYTTQSGVLFRNSHVRLQDIADGTSTTLMAGERPPSADAWSGWWYAGVGQVDTGTPDMLLGVREMNLGDRYVRFCPKGPYHYAPGDLSKQCDFFHFWSLHPGGANFLFADASVHFLTYASDDIMPALATRAGGEVIGNSDW